MLEKVKIALRIAHTHLDSEIEDNIALARAEMHRAGVPYHVANGSSKLVEGAIKTFCLYKFANSKEADGYFKSWEYQLDNIRKSSEAED